MNITKKIGVSLFAFIASVFMVNNVYAAEEFYTLTIDENDVVNVTKTVGETTTPVTFDTVDPYTIDGVLTYNTETDLLTIEEGAKFDYIESYSNLTITTNNKEASINSLELKGENLLEVKDSKITYDESITKGTKSWSAQNILIENSTMDLPLASFLSIDDFFIENSTLKANSASARRGAFKVSDSTIESNKLGGGSTWGTERVGMDWLTPDDYVFMGDHGRAFYGIIFDNSKIKLVGDSQATIRSNRGILVNKSTITDESKLDMFINETINAANTGADDINNTRAITIDGSTVSVNGKISTGSNMDIVINDSTVKSGSNIKTDTGTAGNATGGNITIKNSEVSSKAFVHTSDTTNSSSALLADGNLVIEKSKIMADAKDTKMVAIAYSGKLTLDSESIGLNEDGKELIKDIDISDIEYNRREISLGENKKIYTIGYSTDGGKTVVTDDSDYVRIGEGAKITLTIKDGTWADGTTTPIVVNKIVGDELTEEDLPTGMKSTNGGTKGKWNKSLPLTVSADLDLTYEFEMENPNTSDNIIVYLSLGIISIVTLFSVVSLRKRFQ